MPNSGLSRPSLYIMVSTLFTPTWRVFTSRIQRKAICNKVYYCLVSTVRSCQYRGKMVSLMNGCDVRSVCTVLVNMSLRNYEYIYTGKMINKVYK